VIGATVDVVTLLESGSDDVVITAAVVSTTTAVVSTATVALESRRGCSSFLKVNPPSISAAVVTTANNDVAQVRRVPRINSATSELADVGNP
jgi:hypothetical protein